MYFLLNMVIFHVFLIKNGDVRPAMLVYWSVLFLVQLFWTRCHGFPSRSRPCQVPRLGEIDFVGKSAGCFPFRIHGNGIFTYIYHKNQP